MTMQRFISVRLPLHLFFLLLFFFPPLFAEALSPQGDLPSDEVTLSRLAEINHSLLEINDRIQALQTQIHDLSPETDHEDHTQIQARLTQLESQRRNLRTLFENIATGGVDRTIFSEPEPKPDFDWQQELLSVARPLIAELNHLTERPRILESLRTQRAALQDKITITQGAIARLQHHAQETPPTSPTTATSGLTTSSHLDYLIDEWEEILADLYRQEHLLQMQIESQFGHERSLYSQIKTMLKEFLIGRGLALLLAILLFALSALLIQGALSHLLSFRSKEKSERVSPQKRFLILILRTLGWLFSISLFLITLYVAGDLVLFSLILVILAFLILASRNYLPRYFEEAKLFLNIGPVREKERIIYHGLPWRVRSIGFLVWLENPELTNGHLRLPMHSIKGLTSRPLYHEESWFPTRIGDYVLLNDRTFGRVIEQTPEFVTLSVLHADQTIPTTAFLTTEPRNLSRDRFILNPVGSLDIRYQNESVIEIASKIQNQIEQDLKKSPFKEDFLGLSVTYLQATRSSLDFQILASFKGNAAEGYFQIKKMIQSSFIATTQKQGWKLAIEQRHLHWESTENSPLS